MASEIICTSSRSRPGRVEYTANHNETTAADFTVAAAPGAGFRIVVTGIMISTSVNCVTVFKSGTTEIVRHNCYLYAGVRDRQPFGIFECAEDEALVLTIVGTANTSGWISYVIEEV